MQYKDLFVNSKHDTKRTWQQINNILHKDRNTTYPDKFIDYDKSFTDPVSIANAFNDFFINLGSFAC